MTVEEFEEFKNQNGYSFATDYVFGFNHAYKNPLSSDSVKAYTLSAKTLKWTQSNTPLASLQATSSTDDTYGNIYDETLSKFSDSINEQIIDTAKMSMPFILTGNEDTFNSILTFNNKIVKVGTELTGYDYYKVSATRKTGAAISYYISQDISKIDNINAIPTYLKTKISENTKNVFYGNVTGRIYEYSDYISLQTQKVQAFSFNFTMKSSQNRTHLEDAPYDMFCIPYTDNDFTVSLGSDLMGDAKPFESLDGTVISKSAALSFAQSLAEKLGTNLLDLQLLPYCPLNGWYIDEDNVFTSPQIKSKDIDFIQIENSGLIVPVLYCSTSQGTFNSEQLHLINTQTNEEISMPLPLDNKKIANECDMYRLCSPNYNGQFQFTASKMNGITGFNVDYTYLPYSPYIHINPNFQGLYGQDFDDARGLICQGDFSISYTSSKWQEYQIQNKNYLNIFNRGTENLELTQDIQRKQQIFNAATGTLMGGAGGATMGAAAGPIGAIAGAIVGTAASAIGGALDVKYGDILRGEALDYRQDLFNYQMGNIQALPDSIAKTTAYTKNNKIFPILEYYTCTNDEKKAIANKIAWNGMTVGRIDTMSKFIGNTWSYNGIESKGYIKGKLIRLETVEDDYHIINALSGELDKGVYIK